MTATLPTRMYTSFTADQSAVLLTEKLIKQQPFFFVRYGDGALECITGKKGMTCDREEYGPLLGYALCDEWVKLMAAPESVYVGDWLSASFDANSEHARYAEEYARLIGNAKPHFLHFEALLLMRESRALVDFYKTVKQDPRRKLYMGPKENAAAAEMLGVKHLITPMHNLFQYAGEFTKLLLGLQFDVLLYGAGMAGNIPAIRCWEKHPERTYINLGSALDPLGRGKSRRQQLSPERARALFQELL